MAEDSLGGRCYQCEFFHDSSCKRMENALSSMTDPVCIQKCTLMMIDGIGNMLYSYLNEDDED